MKVMIVLNDAPYGSEKAFNALRLALFLQKEQKDLDLRIFLLQDGPYCALPGQAPPTGFYNVEEMLARVIEGGAVVEACGTCAGARGLKGLPLVRGVKITSAKRMAEWTADSDRVITF
ncbi:MAG: DsrE family protein [Actinomycetota bacterium]